MGSGETDREKQNGDHDSVREVTRPSEVNANDFQQADVSGGNSLRNEAPVEDATAETTHEVIASFCGINRLIVLYHLKEECVLVPAWLHMNTESSF